MTRIIAGSARSLALVVPDAGTRPTSDRVRESLFSALESAGLVAGAVVVDLYAGSGALALEAVSRGAVAADLVEKSAAAATVAERNVRTVLRAASEARVKVHRASADAFLSRSRTAYTLAFIDPPYDLSDNELTRTLALLAPALAPGATAIIERATRSPAPVLDSSLTLVRDKRYGDTTLWWAEKSTTGSEAI